MKKKSLAAAIPLIFAAGFAVAEGTSGGSEMSAGQKYESSASGASGMESGSTTTGMKNQGVPVPETEVRTSTDESRADEVMQRARQLSNDQQSGTTQSSSGMNSGSGETGQRSGISGGASSSYEASRGTRGMESGSTTTGMKGQNVSVPESEVRTSTDESRADEIMQRARQLSNEQQSGSSQSSGGMEGGSGDAGYRSDMNSGGASSSSYSSSGSGGQEPYHHKSASRNSSGMSGGAVHSSGSRGMSPSHVDEKAATTGSSDVGDSTSGGVSAPVPSGERSGYGRMAPPESEAGQSNMMQQGDPSTGWGRMAPPDSGALQGTR